MCCRYWLEESNELKPIVDRMMKSPLVSKRHKSYAAPIKMSGEIRPADLAPVIAMNMGGKKSVFPMKWGFTEKSLLMNARAETSAVKPAFKEAWARHRCIIPASYYFEWEHLISNDGKKHTGDKYLIQPKDSRVTWLCGLYRFENDMPVFTILHRWLRTAGRLRIQVSGRRYHRVLTGGFFISNLSNESFNSLSPITKAKAFSAYPGRLRPRFYCRGSHGQGPRFCPSAPDTEGLPPEVPGHMRPSAG